MTSLLVIDEHGNVEEQAGSFSDWEARGGTHSVLLMRPEASRKLRNRAISSK